MAVAPEAVFTFLLALSTLCLLVYCIYNKRAWALPLLGLSGLSWLIIRFGWWPLSFVFVPLLFVPLWKKVGYEGLAILSMVPAIAVAHLLLTIFSTYRLPGLMWIALTAVTVVCVLGILGTFQNDLKKFMVISNLLQLVFVMLDLSVASITGTLNILGSVQIFNYTFAGVLLFLTIGVLSRNLKHKTISDMEGRFYCEKHNAIGAVIAGLSLVGIPSLNIFVAEYYLFVAAFSLNPMIAVMGVFAALILYIMYFKIPYALLVSKEEMCFHTPRPITWVSLGLTAAVIILGMVPWIQLYIFTG